MELWYFQIASYPLKNFPNLFQLNILNKALHSNPVSILILETVEEKIEMVTI